MKVGIFNVKYSPNLGDGLLSECLERQLEQCNPAIETIAIDLAGRIGYGPPRRFRAPLLRLLNILPRFVRQFLANIVLGHFMRRKLSLQYRQGLAQCDAVVVGGGNLFADADLNFPIKINAALAEANNRDLPVAVFGVGVSAGWSTQGHKLFESGLTSARLVMAAVRDLRSKALWDELLDDRILRSEIVRDPGLLAAFHYPRGAPAASGKLLGLCITDPAVLLYHSSSGVGGVDAQWYGNAIVALRHAGFEIVFFTNGSIEDRLFLDAHLDEWKTMAGSGVSRAPDFAVPADLVKFLSSCNIVVAHRMHACIAAHSFAIPTLGLSWDLKLDSFFDITGRSRYMVDTSTIAANTLADLAIDAVEEGVDQVAHRDLLDATRNDVAKLAEALVSRGPKA